MDNFSPFFVEFLQIIACLFEIDFQFACFLLVIL